MPFMTRHDFLRSPSLTHARLPAAALAVALFATSIAIAVADIETGTTGTAAATFENRQPTQATRYIIALQGVFPNDEGGSPHDAAAHDRSTPFIGEIRPVAFDFAPSGWAFCEGQSLPINQNQALYALIQNTYGGNNVSFNLPDLRGRVPIGQGQGPGLPNYVLGQKVGAAQPSLSAANLPSHKHALPDGGSTASSGTGTPMDNVQPALALNLLIRNNGELMIAAWQYQPHGWARCNGQLFPIPQYELLFNTIGSIYGGDGESNFRLPDLRGRAIVGTNEGSSWPIGASFGTTNQVLPAAVMPAHTHSVNDGQTGSAGGTGATLDNHQPSLVMKWLIALYGSFPSPNGSMSSPATGEMRIIAGSSAVGLGNNGWVPCNGNAYPDVEAYGVLVGDIYGSYAAVPDLRGRLNSHADATLAVGRVAGETTFTISAANLAAHAHGLPAEIDVQDPTGTRLLDGGSTIDFGTTSTSGSVSRTITIRNVGGADLLLGAVTKDGEHSTDFVVDGPATTTLAPNDTTTISILFAPSASGRRTAVIQIASNDESENPFDLSLTGVGDVQATPTPTVPPPTASPSPTPSPTATPSPTPNATPAPGRALNISTRMRVQTGDNVLIGGFIVQGEIGSTKRVILRGIGPSLATLNGALANPVLDLYDDRGEVIVSNDDWRIGGQAAELEATGIPPSHDLEPAIIATLSPGVYTAVLRGNGDGTGIGVVEAYDLDQQSPAQFANIATRGRVEVGDDVMIGGFIVGGETQTRMLIRGLGPSLAAAGVPGALADPVLELYNANGLVMANSDWRDTQEQELSDTKVAPSDDREAALLISLAPGAYTAILRGAGDGTGVGLIEVYNLGLQ